LPGSTGGDALIELLMCASSEAVSTVSIAPRPGHLTRRG
jgi:hypothetical protein